MMLENPCYIHYSEPEVTPLFTDHGYYPVHGVHALAGLEITSFPFHQDIPFDQVDSQEWSNRIARFWLSLAYSANSQDSAYQTSFELRLHSQPQNDPGLSASLWIKTFAADDLKAAQIVEHWLERMAWHMPAPCQAQPVKFKQDFERLWGASGPPDPAASADLTSRPMQWLGEVRRAGPVRTRPLEPGELPAYYSMADWFPSFSGWREAWALLARLSGETWLSIGICPTVLLPAESAVLQEWAEIAEDASAGQYWSEKRLNLLMQAFLLRIRLGGDFFPAQILGQSLNAALLSGAVEAEIQQRVYRQPVIKPARQVLASSSIVWPDSIMDWERARFNWTWADFLDWGNAVMPPPHLIRLPYLATTAEAGLLAGIWF